MLKKLIVNNLPKANLQFSGIDRIDAIDNLLSALEWNWVNGNNPASTPYWADKVGHVELDNFIYALSEAGWIVSKADARKKWGEFCLNQDAIDAHLSAIEQLEYRTKLRVNKYKMRYVENYTSNMTKTKTGTRDTGLDRPGMAKSANQPFRLDVAYLAKYYDAIQLNLTKSMDKVIKKHPTIKQDSSNYKVITQELLDYYIFHEDKEYNLEGNLNDSRGRAIYNGLRRVGNPISNKDFRACLVVPKGKYIESTDVESLKEIYLFIAELIGSKAKSWTAKMHDGRDAFMERKLHELDLTDEEDRKELHENIWLERIYSRLEEVFDNGYSYWDIPIEVDATMSLAQIFGILSNDERLLDKTNVINASDLKDAWFVEGVPRIFCKTVGTPRFYGSAQSATTLLRSKKHKYTKEHLRTINKEFSKGAFGVINTFKDFLIQHASVDTPEIEMTIWDETFTIPVSKHKAVGATTNAYSIWDSEKQKTVTFFNHDVITVPDYDRFRLYYATGLIHNLDSRVLDKVLQKLDEWAIAIHDAILVLPGSKARALYVQVLEELRKVRHEVVSNYRRSIGATSRASDIAWAKLMDIVQPLCSAVPFEESALK